MVHPMRRNKNHGFRNRNNVRAAVVVLALGCFSLTATARGYAPVVSPLPTGFQIKFASNGTPLATMKNGNSAVAVTGTTAIPLSGMAVLNAAITGAVTGASFGGAWGAALAGVGAVALLAVPALLDAYQRAKLRADPVTGLLQAATTSSCPFRTATTPEPSPNYQYYSNRKWFSSEPNALLYSGQKNTYGCAYGWQWDYTPDLQNPSVFYKQQSVDLIETPGAAVDKWNPIPPTDAVALMSAGVPTTPNVQALVDLSFPPPVDPVSITGPAELPLFNTVTLDSKGVQTTVAESASFAYFPDSVGMKRKTTTTVVTPAVAPTDANPAGVPAKTEVSTTDSTDKPKDSRSECEKSPKSAGCAELDTPEGEIPRSSRTVTYQAEDVFGGGSCPANLTANVGLLRKSVTVWDWQKTCELALPLRALILALASFAAFLIVMPGKVDT